ESQAWISGMGIRYIVRVDGISIFMIAITALLFPLGLLAASRYLPCRVKACVGWHLLLVGAIVGIFLCMDLILVFVFWHLRLVLTEAPTVGSVVLAGVILKMGAYGFVRFSFELFPQASVDLAPLLLVLAIIGILYGAIVAAMQTDLKRIIAYSSVAHMGFV